MFARLIYNEGLSNFGRRGRSSWATDWPKADKQFIFAIDRMSNVRVVLDKDVAIEIMDPNLFSYPFIYALEVGRGMNLSQQEAERLREYMLRGGFLVIDDFWGTYQWQNFYIQLKNIFPDKEAEAIPMSHQLFLSRPRLITRSSTLTRSCKCQTSGGVAVGVRHINQMASSRMLWRFLMTIAVR